MPQPRSERDQSEVSLSLLADIIRIFMPNFSGVNRILRARVPIIKINFEPAPIEIDLSIEVSTEYSHHGLLMAEYINYATNVDENIKKFLIFIKIWAKQNG